MDYYCDLSIVIHVTDSAGIDIYNTEKEGEKRKETNGLMLGMYYRN